MLTSGGVYLSKLDHSITLSREVLPCPLYSLMLLTEDDNLLIPANDVKYFQHSIAPTRVAVNGDVIKNKRTGLSITS